MSSPRCGSGRNLAHCKPPLLDDEIAKYKGFKDEINKFVEDAKSGAITIPDMAAMIDAKKVQMQSSLEVIKDIQSRGTSWWEIVLWSILGTTLGSPVARGIPSKGIVRALINGFKAKKA